MHTNKKKPTLSPVSILKQASAEHKASTAVTADPAPSEVKTEEPVTLDLSAIGQDGNSGVMADSTGPTDQTDQEPVKTDTPPVANAASDLTDLVKVRMPKGTIEHGTVMKNGQKRWMRTPTWQGRERWFDRTKITDWGKDDDGMFAIVTRKEVAQREMLSFIVPEASTPAAAEGEGVQA